MTYVKPYFYFISKWYMYINIYATAIIALIKVNIKDATSTMADLIIIDILY